MLFRKALFALVLVSFTLSLARAGDEEWYGENLERTVEKYHGLKGIPRTSIQWLSRTFGRSPSQVVADLGRQEGALTPLTTAPVSVPASPEVTIPDASWDRDPTLDPTYARAIEELISKYGGVAFVPEASIRWMSRRWGREERQVRLDLQRIDHEDPDQLSDVAYSN